MLLLENAFYPIDILQLMVQAIVNGTCSGPIECSETLVERFAIIEQDVCVRYIKPNLLKG